MADGGEGVGIGPCVVREEVQASNVIPNGLHGAALVAGKVGRVIGEVRISGREAEITAPDEFDAVFVVWAFAEANDYFLAGFVGLMKSEDSNGLSFFWGRLRS